MRKKPNLKVVGASASDPDAPPVVLGKVGQTLWRKIMREYQIVDSGGLALLEQACSAMDDVATDAAIIRKDGRVIWTKGGAKEHPLLKHQLASRAFATRTLVRLGLDVQPIQARGRPSIPIAWSGNNDD
jgi:phage terminase small subunit